jgi:hypothetical protein
MSIVRGAVLGIAAVAVAVMAAGAGAGGSETRVSGIPSRAGVFTACMVATSGDVRLVRTGRACRAGEQKVSWSEQGPAGKPGPTGQDGKDGKDGVDGKDGADGLDGADGWDGLDGKDGKDGKDGAPGPPGPPGPSGATQTQLVHGTPQSTAVDAVAGTAFETTASCPAGKNVLGGGGQISVSVAEQLGRAVLVESYPIDSGTWKIVAAVTTTLEGASASVSAWAVCQA